VQHSLTLDIDRQGLTQTERTKYTEESNIMRWKTGETDETICWTGGWWGSEFRCADERIMGSVV